MKLQCCNDPEGDVHPRNFKHLNDARQAGWDFGFVNPRQCKAIRRALKEGHPVPPIDVEDV